MKTLIQLEEAILFLFCLYLYTHLGYPWWLFPALLLVPDISMAGYLFNKELGATIYNIVHFRGLGLLLYLAATYLASPPLQLAGLIIFAHSTMDRAFGYGLKLKSGFKHTHLGEL